MTTSEPASLAGQPHITRCPETQMKHARKSRRMCPVCQQRPAKFAIRGHVKRDRQHVLCFACHRALIDSHRLAHPLPFMLNLPTNLQAPAAVERVVTIVSVPIPRTAAR